MAASFPSASCLLPCGFDADLVTQAAKGCLAQLGGNPDLAIVFATSDYREHLVEMIEILRIDGHARRIAGGSAGGVLGLGREIERSSGLSLLFLRSRPPEQTETKPSTAAPLLLLGNPLETDLNDQIRSANRKGCPAAGGFVSGGPSPEDLFLFDENGLLDTPSLTVNLPSGFFAETMLIPGTRPIGEPLVVTGAVSDEVVSIGRRDALTVLEETFDALPDEIRAYADGTICAGLALQEEVDDFDAADFLVRHIIGADLDRGHLQLASPPRTGQTLQFQMRDGIAAESALRDCCLRTRERRGTPFAGVFFAGQSRGRALYGADDRDMLAVSEHLGKFPLAGLFTNGEVGGPAGKTNRHEHTLSGLLLYLEDSPS